MNNSCVLIVGCGDLGIRTASILSDQGWSVTGVRRDISRLPAPIQAHAADYTLSGSLDFAARLKPDYVLATFNPFDRSIAGYKAGFGTGMANLLQGLGLHRPQAIIMASSTRVFAEADGGWIDEGSALSNSDPWARQIIAAEEQLLASTHRASIVRFAGIYGIPGGRLLSRIRRGELCPAAPVSYTNRIHREDCGGFLAHLLLRAQTLGGESLERVYIGADDEPAPRYEVESWLAREMGVDVAVQELSDVVEQPTQHNQSGHRRCRNQALRDSGYQLRYANYKQGYEVLLR